MLFLGGGMHGRELSVAPDQHTYQYPTLLRAPLPVDYFDRAGSSPEAVPLDYDTYSRRKFAAENRWRNVMVKTNLSDGQAQALLVEWLLARWVAAAREPEGGAST